MIILLLILIHLIRLVLHLHLPPLRLSSPQPGCSATTAGRDPPGRAPPGRVLPLLRWFQEMEAMEATGPHGPHGGHGFDQGAQEVGPPGSPPLLRGPALAGAEATGGLMMGLDGNGRNCDLVVPIALQNVNFLEATLGLRRVLSRVAASLLLRSHR